MMPVLSGLEEAPTHWCQDGSIHPCCSPASQGKHAARSWPSWLQRQVKRMCCGQNKLGLLSCFKILTKHRAAQRDPQTALAMWCDFFLSFFLLRHLFHHSFVSPHSPPQLPPRQPDPNYLFPIGSCFDTSICLLLFWYCYLGNLGFLQYYYWGGHWGSAVLWGSSTKKSPALPLNHLQSLAASCGTSL